jgi:Asparagine synthase
MSPAPTLTLMPLEIASGFPIGEAAAAALPAERVPSPRTALERAILPALRRAPCVVSFSGGRDSSAVLALATHLARREGLPPPLPVTLRFPGMPQADETAWQEVVVRHLGLVDWQRDDIADELDLIGPVAAGVLRRHGLLWPPNSHFHQPIIERARRGSILTGIDGDGVLASWRWARPARVLRGEVRPRLRDAARLGLAAAPRPVRRIIERRRPPTVIPWLRPDAQAQLHEIRSAEVADEPARWDRWIPWYARRRSLRMVLQAFDLLAGDAEVRAVHPFADPLFLAALARAGRGTGIGSRRAVMELLVGDLLPPEVVRRQSKAILDAPFWNRHSRAFSTGWDGRFVDPSIVDPAALRVEWSSEQPHACASTLLQAAWLSATAEAAPQGLS